MLVQKGNTSGRAMSSHQRVPVSIWGSISIGWGVVYAGDDGTDTAHMNVFLDQLSLAYPNDYILLLLDNAAWHRSGTLVIPENIELFPLLPYTPELNPIEQIWEEIREKGFRNEVFDSLRRVVDRLCMVTVNLMDDVERVASITHRSWLIDALMF